MKLFFHGGARMVTGANYLLETGDKGQETRILVDCGLHQGSRFCERHNWEPFQYSPSEISAVFVTHSHVDHIGRLPKLVKDGFKGTVYSTSPTRDFSELLLLDSQHLLSEEARHFKKPELYSIEDVDRLMKQWRAVEYHEEIRIGPLSATLWNAGHILGSSFVAVEAEGKKILFSGDLGNSPAPLIGPWETYGAGATHCLVESTYGDRIHEDLPQRKEILEDLIEDTVKNRGTLMIPAFAMERTQELLFEIDDLVDHGRIPSVPIFLDSPLAIKLTEVYKRNEKFFDPGAKGLVKSAEHIFNFRGLKTALTTEESKAINNAPPPKVIIAGSGMSHGGRILHHERRYLPDPKSTLLIVGYQAQGSLGRQILDGADSVRMFGEEVSVRCRVKAIGGYSAHADQTQLLRWLEPLRLSLKELFVVQGEEAASRALAQRVVDELAIKTEIPTPGQEVVL